MAATYNAYIYTEESPTDAILQIARDTIGQIIGESDFTVKGQVAGLGHYNLNFNDSNDDQRTMTVFTRMIYDMPSTEEREEVGINDIFVSDDERTGIIINLGSWGMAEELVNAVAANLSFLGPVLFRDEATEQQELKSLGIHKSLTEVLTDLDYSVYQARNVLRSLVSFDSGAATLLGIVLEDSRNMTTDEVVEKGGFSRMIDNRLASFVANNAPGM